MKIMQLQLIYGSNIAFSSNLTVLNVKRGRRILSKLECKDCAAPTQIWPQYSIFVSSESFKFDSCNVSLSLLFSGTIEISDHCSSIFSSGTNIRVLFEIEREHSPRQAFDARTFFECLITLLGLVQV